MSWTPDTDAGSLQSAAERRTYAITELEQLSSIQGVRGLKQIGTDHRTARLLLDLTGQPELEIAGGFDTLMSRAKMLRLFLARGYDISPCKPADWEGVARQLIICATDVIPDEDEQIGAVIADHLEVYRYRNNASLYADVPAAAAIIQAEEPFNTPTHYYLKVSHFSLWLKRDRLVTTLTDKDIRHGLTDLGFDRVAVNYNTDGKGARRSTASYYRITSEALRTQAPEK